MGGGSTQMVRLSLTEVICTARGMLVGGRHFEDLLRRRGHAVGHHQEGSSTVCLHTDGEI